MPNNSRKTWWVTTKYGPEKTYKLGYAQVEEDNEYKAASSVKLQYKSVSGRLDEYLATRPGRDLTGINNLVSVNQMLEETYKAKVDIVLSKIIIK